jgi:hypothetical protein
MTHYLRTMGTTEAVPFETAEAAIKQVQENIAHQKAVGRVVSRDGERILFHEKTGELFEAMWVEDEGENHVHVPMA